MLLDPRSSSLPKRSELPDIPGTPKGAAWFWGKDDEVWTPLPHWKLFTLLIKRAGYSLDV